MLLLEKGFSAVAACSKKFSVATLFYLHKIGLLTKNINTLLLNRFVNELFNAIKVEKWRHLLAKALESL